MRVVRYSHAGPDGLHTEAIEDFVELSLHGMAATTEPPAQP